MQVSFEQSAAARRRLARAKDQAVLRRMRASGLARNSSMRANLVLFCQERDTREPLARVHFELAEAGFPHNATLAWVWATAAQKAILCEAINAAVSELRP